MLVHAVIPARGRPRREDCHKFRLAKIVLVVLWFQETNLAHIRYDYLWSSQDFLRHRGHFQSPAANALLAVGFEHRVYPGQEALLSS